MAQHDASYKLLFSHRELVADLLRGFLPAEWVSTLDFASLERLGTSFISDQLDQRHADLVWRVRHGPNWLYVLILLEFQSTEDHYMAVRIGAYVHLLYQDLIRTGYIENGAKLPPLIPIVLYNGQSRWRAATDLFDLIDTVPAGLEQYQPQMRYLLIDEGRYSDDTLSGLEKNLAAALFRLERSPTINTLGEIVQALKMWLADPQQAELRRAFTIWVRRVLLPLRLPGVEIPEINELEELDAMLAERVVEWTEQWKREGLEQGLQQGLLQGLLQGLQQGRDEERQLLLRQVELRFGAHCAAALSPQLATINEPAQFTTIGELIVQSTDGKQLIDAVKALLA